MNRTALLVLVLLVAVVMSGCTGQQEAAPQSADGAQQADMTELQTECENTRVLLCEHYGEIAESDYADQCFEDGEHVLDNPYTCP